MYLLCHLVFSQSPTSSIFMVVHFGTSNIISQTRRVTWQMFSPFEKAQNGCLACSPLWGVSGGWILSLHNPVILVSAVFMEDGHQTLVQVRWARGPWSLLNQHLHHQLCFLQVLAQEASHHEGQDLSKQSGWKVSRQWKRQQRTSSPKGEPRSGVWGAAAMISSGQFLRLCPVLSWCPQ